MKKLVFAILVLFAITSSAQDLDSTMEMLRSDIKTEKVAYITEVMQFTEDESTAFWPIYREYQFKLDEIADQYLGNIKTYGENYGSLSDEMASDLVKDGFDLKKDRLNLQKDYFKKFSKALSPVKAARWVQLENQLGLLLELQVVSAIPFATKPFGQ